MTRDEALRNLPSVDEILRDGWLDPALGGSVPRRLLVEAVRDGLDGVRQAILKAASTFDQLAAPAHLRACLEAACRRVLLPHTTRAINATGVILHTGLGRAVLPDAALDAIQRELRGYATLEVDRATGERSHREKGVAELLQHITGAEAATVVNNNAAGVLLALAALARGREVVTSRGQLVEIGGSFRIPDIMAQSGARLVEVGTTNRTHLADYERAITKETAVLLRVHTSNFRIVGFVHDVPLEDLVALASRQSLLVMDDLGSGNLVDLSRLGLHEPLAQASVKAGADVVTFSGDKLLGGPQAGIIVGRAEAVHTIRSHPLFRAVRPDKLALVGLEATLRLYLDPDRAFSEIPTLRQLALDEPEVERRAEALAERLRAVGRPAEVVRTEARTGSGALPAIPIASRAVSLEIPHPDDAAARLRLGNPPVFARIAGDRLLLDVRTILPEDEEPLVRALCEALETG